MSTEQPPNKQAPISPLKFTFSSAQFICYQSEPILYFQVTLNLPNKFALIFFFCNRTLHTTLSQHPPTVCRVFYNLSLVFIVVGEKAKNKIKKKKI